MFDGIIWKIIMTVLEALCFIFCISGAIAVYWFGYQMSPALIAIMCCDAAFYFLLEIINRWSK